MTERAYDGPRLDTIDGDVNYTDRLKAAIEIARESGNTFLQLVDTSSAYNDDFPDVYVFENGELMEYYHRTPNGKNYRLGITASGTSAEIQEAHQAIADALGYDESLATEIPEFAPVTAFDRQVRYLGPYKGINKPQTTS